MNCSEVQDCLSQFYDNELSQSIAVRVAGHVTDCSTCEEELAAFEQLSGLSQQLIDPLVPNHLWEELQTKLNDSVSPKKSRPGVQPNFDSGRPRFPEGLPVPGRLLVLAATVLVAAGIGFVSYWSWFSYGHNHLAVDFAYYLEEFSERPDNAQKVLLANYNGRSTTLEEAEKVLGYRPVVANGLPPGYSLEEVHLLTMPCCTCAHVICKNKAGKSIAIFEHAIDQPIWFGDRPTIDCLCHEVPTKVRQVGDRLAATWQEGSRHITIIGATDLDEVTEFVAYFKELSPG